MNIYITVFTVAVVLTLIGYFWLANVGFKRSVLWGVLILLLSPITAIVYAMTNWFDARKAFLTYIVSFVLMCGAAILIYDEVGTGNMHQIADRMHSGKLGPFKAYALITKALNHAGPLDLFAEESNLAAADQTVSNATQLAGNTPSPKVANELVQVTNETDKLAGAKNDVKPDAAPVPATLKDVEDAETKAAKDSETKSTEVKPAEVKVEKPKYATPDQAQPDPLAQKRKKEEANTVKVSLEKMPKYIGHYFIITLKNGHQRRGLLRSVDATTLHLDRKLYGGNVKFTVSKTQIKTIEMLTRLPDER
jgi:hypothetical protein